MALFKKRQKGQTEDEAYRFMTVGEALAYSRGEKVDSPTHVLGVIEENCRQIQQIEKQQQESKAEFAAVTSYLSDIQRIESIPQGERSAIKDLAESIISINAETAKYHDSEKALTPRQYADMKLYADELPGQIARMEENERYQILVNNDLKQLEGERGVIKYEIEQLSRRQRMLRSFLICACVFTACAFALLLFLTRATGKDFMAPFFAAGVLALGAAFYVLVSMRSASLKLMQDERKLRRVVSLLNKIKIKYVNVTNVLDYTYDKYNVHSHHELEYRWQLYLREKKEEERQKKSSQRLSITCSALVDELRRWQVADCAVWTRQPEALVDRRELIELKDRLDGRHKRLRAAIEFGNRQLMSYREEIDRVLSQNPQQEDAILSVMRGYGISP